MRQYFEHLSTLAEIKAEYKRLVKINHPDVGGDTATMQEINRQYGEAVKWVAEHGEGSERRQAEQEIPEEFAAVLSKVINLDGLEIDLVGAWLWATGNTWAHKAALKAAGFRWASKKRAWYWRPEWAAVSHSSRKSLGELMDWYGAQRIISAGDERKTTPQLAAM